MKFITIILIMAIWLSLPTMVKSEEAIELQTFWISEGEKAAFNQLVEHARTNDLSITPIYKKDYADLRQSTSRRLGAGYPPEVTHWIGGEDLSLLVDTGDLMILPDQIGGKKIEEMIFPDVLNDIHIKGKYYAIPVGVHLQSIIVYNKKVLNHAGIQDIPQTWEDWFKASALLEKAGYMPYAATSESWVLREVFHGILLGLGGKQALKDMYGDFDASGELFPVLVDGMEVLLRLRGLADEEHRNRNWADMVKYVIDGKAGFTIIGDFAGSEIATHAPDRLDEILCQSPPGVKAAYFGVDIFVGFKTGDPDWNERFEKLLAVILSPETQRDYLAHKGGLPVLQNMDMRNLSPCSQNSVNTWLTAEEGRFSSPGPRDIPRIIALMAIVPEIWNTGVMSELEAAKLIYDTLGSIE